MEPREREGALSLKKIHFILFFRRRRLKRRRRNWIIRDKDVNLDWRFIYWKTSLVSKANKQWVPTELSGFLLVLFTNNYWVQWRFQGAKIKALFAFYGTFNFLILHNGMDYIILQFLLIISQYNSSATYQYIQYDMF